MSAALADLEFSQKRIAKSVKKTLQSAIANAENNHGLDVDDLIVADFNNSARQETSNQVTVDRRTGKFTGPDSNGSCAKAALVAMPGQKF